MAAAFKALRELPFSVLRMLMQIRRKPPHVGVMRRHDAQRRPWMFVVKLDGYVSECA